MRNGTCLGGEALMIFYVEDDPNIRELTIYALNQAGFEVEGFAEARALFHACSSRVPDLILLDIMLPSVDGMEVLRRLRLADSTRTVPVMMLTAKGSELDKAVGLDAGADDHLAKPFGTVELIYRVKALLRRARVDGFGSIDSAVISCDPVELSASAHVVRAGGCEVVLTLKEFSLLRALLENQGCVLSSLQLLGLAWDVADAGETRTADVHVQTLRKKLTEALPGAGGIIQTVRGVGYCAKERA